MIVKVDLSDDTSNQVVATYSCGCVSAFTVEFDESNTKLEITDQVLIKDCQQHANSFCVGGMRDNLLILQVVANFNLYQNQR